MRAASSWHVDLDGAWSRGAAPGAFFFDAREWGPGLRYSTTRGLVNDFYERVAPSISPFTLYGSGDFHYLTALWLRQIEEPFTLVSFDNHPDWDVRPPYWCCGTWINRALTLPQLRDVAIWGCGNFELDWPNRLFANHGALRANRLQVWPWAARVSASARKKWPGINDEDWRQKFETFAAALAGGKVYVTVDFDCLRAEEATTNWENGLFTAAGIAWALGRLRQHAEIIGGDVCGAYSPARYIRFKQRIEANLDHPNIGNVDSEAAEGRNLRALRMIWPALTGRDENHAEANEQNANP